MPCVAFLTAKVGSRMPPALFCSGTSTLTTTRSPTGATVLYCNTAGSSSVREPLIHGAGGLLLLATRQSAQTIPVWALR